MIAVDTNILVYAYHRESEWNAAAVRCLRQLAEDAPVWAIPWPCVHEFLAVVTNPRVFRRPSSWESAAAQMDAWMESPTLRLLGEMAGHWRELKRAVEGGRILGAAIHDARIAALCLEHGVAVLWTADRDFSRIAGLRIQNPLLVAH